ncbi:hypothetical protein Nepgr_019228 [Nepenthes gracilis]|uniref:Uncharacterized protein n=1 Tax=Nepenthes gracilis TaxID=150966 RepID=A0AAD3SVF7_NEPGR|nr:hypothetical protein Nepgr_019228 [Nepenthes gracilis]
MDKDSGSWLYERQLYGKFTVARPLKLPAFDLGLQRIGVASPPPCASNISTGVTCPLFGFLNLPNSKECPVKKQPHGWFNCLPEFRPGVTFMPEMIHGEKLLPNINFTGKVPPPAAAAAYGKCDDPNVGSSCPKKQFLVFDQTGGKTLMYSSGLHCLTSWSPKPIIQDNLSWEDMGMKGDAHYHSEPNLTDEDCRSNGRSRLHEDTEEINALLYSDDDEADCYLDDEETSTGRSPTTMTACHKQDCFEEAAMDEVSSSASPTKRRKLSNGDCYRLVKSFEHEEDAESSCAEGKPMKFAVMGSLSGNKRPKEERIRETVNILRSIIPAGEGKDAIMVLDEAIDYLRTLKVKAKSLRLYTL